MDTDDAAGLGAVDGADDADRLADADDRDGDVEPAIAIPATTPASAANPAPIMSRGYRRERRLIGWPISSLGSLVES